MPMTDAALPADTCVWLASPEAEFLKGRMTWCDWDADELKAKKEEIVEKDLLKPILAGVVGGYY